MALRRLQEENEALHQENARLRLAHEGVPTAAAVSAEEEESGGLAGLVVARAELATPLAATCDAPSTEEMPRADVTMAC